MSHFVFIAASYGVSVLALGLLAVWQLADYRSQQRTLGELEARGRGRRARAAAVGGTARP